MKVTREIFLLISQSRADASVAKQVLLSSHAPNIEIPDTEKQGERKHLLIRETKDFASYSLDHFITSSKPQLLFQCI